MRRPKSRGRRAPLQDRAETIGGFGGFLTIPEGGQTEEAFAGLSEARAGRPDQPRFFKEEIEEAPGGHAVGALHPEIGGILAAGEEETAVAERGGEDGGVFAVIGDQLPALTLAAGGEGGLRAPLHHIGDAVELGGLPPCPESAELHAVGLQLLRNDRPAAARAGEARPFREGIDLDGAAARPLDFKDRAGAVAGDEALVGGVEDDQRAGAEGIADPIGKPSAGIDGAGGIVGGAEVDDVGGVPRRRGREELILLGGGDEGDRAAAHQIAVDVDGIDGVGDEDGIVAQDIGQIAEIAFGAVPDVDLVGREADAPAAIGIGDRFADKIVAVFRRIAAEGRLTALLRDRLLHGLCDAGGEGQGHVPDAEADDLAVGMGGAEGIHPRRDFAEEIALLHVKKMSVDLNLDAHILYSLVISDRLRRPPRSDSAAIGSGTGLGGRLRRRKNFVCRLPLR